MTKDEALKLALEALETPWNAPYVDGCDLALGKKVKAITAIKEALAQPEQEPYDQTALELREVCGWKTLIPSDTCLNCERKPPLPVQERSTSKRIAPYSTTLSSLLNSPAHNIRSQAMKPIIEIAREAGVERFAMSKKRTWVGLTDKEIEAIWQVAMFANYGVGAELSNQPFVHYARAIEAKLKEKNK